MKPKMQVIVPMAGRGDRFLRAGYKDIKPLIVVDGRPIVEHVTNLFPGEKDFLFICANDHLENTKVKRELKRIAPAGQIVGIAPHKLGPVHTALEGADYIRDEAPVALTYCDYSLYWNYDSFLRYVEKTDCDGCIISYKGFHPHSLGPNLYGYLRMDGDRVLEIREKGCFTDDKMGEFASAGLYYFRSGKLMKQYFRKAVELGLTAKGEYFASLPYNPMIADGLDIRVFEVEHFLQWGTPEDLQEYQGWSQYFGSEPQPSPRPRAGWTTLIPMAGEGSRFRAVGYREPKPLIPVSGTPMISRVLESLPKSGKQVAICQKAAAAAVGAGLEKLGTPVTIQTVPALTCGAVATCLAGESAIDPNSPLLVAACDSALFFDDKKLDALTSDPKTDFLCFTFRNHPHANRNPKQYAWAELRPDGTISKVKCKVPLRDGDVSRDPGITGTFWFRRAGDFFDACRKTLKALEGTKTEAHVDLAVSLLAESGATGRVLDLKHFICMGTPDDVRTYEYWANYFRKIAYPGKTAKTA